MGTNPLDNPVVLSMIFYPRADVMASQPEKGIFDGTIPVEDDIVLGYRLHMSQPGHPVIVFFHGNGEIASDYASMAPLFYRAGASLLVVDYRGYGWSTGQPKISTLGQDVESVFCALPDILSRAGVTGEDLYLMGRSLGSAYAIQMAYTHSSSFRGLIIESGFANTFLLLERLGFPPQMLVGVPDPINNGEKMRTMELPLLVIHGVRDMLIPFMEGLALYEASPVQDKTLVRINGGHNDLLMFGAGPYFASIQNFLNSTL
nr:alpha/beta fold hydrolase [Anaerolineae bacterium]